MQHTEFWTSLTPDDPRRVPTEAAKLEADGWDGAVLVDSQCMFPDVWTLLAVCAPATSRITLATGTTNPVTRHPSVTASAAASLQVLSGGRTVLGIGRGDSALAYVGASPMAISAFERYLHVLQTYLRGESVAMAEVAAMVIDAKVGFDDLAIGSGPSGSSLTWLQRYDVAKVPVEAYATGPRAIASAAREADTVILGLAAEINRVTWGVDLARRAAQEAGREVGVGCVVLALPHEDVDCARNLARPTVATMSRFSVMNNKVIGPATTEQTETLLRLAEVYDMNKHGRGGVQGTVLSDDFVDQFAIVGSVDTCVERLNEFVELGLTRLSLVTPYTRTPELAHSYHLLINHVLPQVRGA